MKVKTLIDEIRFINTHIKENKGVFTIDVKKLNSILDYIDELEKENKKLNELVQFNVKTTITLTKRINKAIEYINNYMPNYDFDHYNLEKLLEMLKGE